MIKVEELVMTSGWLTHFISPERYRKPQADAVPAGVLDGFPIPDVGAGLTRIARVCMTNYPFFDNLCPAAGFCHFLSMQIKEIVKGSEQ